MATRRTRRRPSGWRDLLLPAVGVAVLAGALWALSPATARQAREWLLIRSPSSAGPRHLQYAPADDAERDRFLVARSDVEVVVPWTMTAEELLNLYMLRTHPTAPARVEAEAGGPGGTLLEGTTFTLPLN